MHIKYAILFLIIVYFPIHTSAQWLTIKGGHSHNDYHRERPLLEALENGMASIEADVFLWKGQILVGHDTTELSENRTFEKMYLAPLHKLVTDKKHKTQKSLILMIDIKNKGTQAYKALKQILLPYKKVLTKYNNGKIVRKSITIILSGNRPIASVMREKKRCVFLDGRINDLPKNKPASTFPLVSDQWNKYFTWEGKGNMPKQEFEKLKRLANECHKQNKMIRFWGTPGKCTQTKKIWKVLLAAKVDLIGTDNPKCLNNFMNPTNKNK